MSEPTPTEPVTAPPGAGPSVGPKARAPASRRDFVNHAWQLLLATVIGLPLASMLGAWAVLHSDRGTAWLLRGVPGLQVTAPQGALLGPDFAAENVLYRWDSGRQSIEIQGLKWSGAQWRWWLRAGTWAGVQALTLQARRVVVHTGPATGQPLRVPKTLTLPIELQVQQAKLERLEVDTLPAWREIRGRLELGGQQGTVHRVEGLWFQWDELAARGQARIHALTPFQGEARLEVEGTGTTHWEGELSASGPLQTLELKAQLRVPAPPGGLVRPSLQGQAQLRLFEPWPLGTVDARLQSLNLSQLSSSLPATRLTGRAAVQSAGLHEPVQADIVLDNAAAGPWDDARLPVRRLHLDARSRIDAPGEVQIRHLDLDLGSAQRPAGLWRSSGSWSGAELRLQGMASDLQPQALDQRAPAMSWSGPLKLGLLGFALAHRTGPGGARPPTPWTLEFQGSLSGALDGLGQRTNLTLDGSLKPQALELRQLLAEAGSARAQLSGTVKPGAEGAWLVRSSGQIVEFDPVPWIPGTPADAWRKGPHRINAEWNVDLLAPVWKSGASAPQWLQTLQGSAQVEMGPSRVSGLAASGRLKLSQTPSAAPAERSQLQGELRLGRNLLTVSGQGDPGGGGAADRWQVQVAAAALGELAPLGALWPALAGWVPQAGKMEAQASASGRWPDLTSQGSLLIEGLKSGEYAMARGEARWQWSGQEGQPLALSGQMQEASLGPNRVARLHGELRGTLRQHSASLDVALPLRPPQVVERVLELPAGTGTQARVSLEGGWTTEAAGGGRWTGTVQRLEAGVWSPAVPGGWGVSGRANGPGGLSGPSGPQGPGGAQERAWLDASQVRSELRFDAARRLRSLRLEAGQATLAAGLRLKWDEARYELRDPARADRPDFQWQAEVLPFALAPWLQRADTGLQWTGDLRLSARMQVRAAERFEAQVRVQRHDGDLQVTESGQVQPLGISTVDMALQAQDGVWSLAPRFVGRSVGEITGAVQLRTDPGARWPDDQAALSGSVQARVPNLGVWSGWTPAGWRIQGEVTSTASLGGRFGAPQLTGDLSARQVGVRNLLQGVDYTDGELQVVLQGETARIERLSLRAGEGRLTGEGVGEFGARPNARLQVRAQGFRVLGRLDRQLVASGQAVLALRPDQLKLDGRVDIDSGLFDLASRDAPSLDEDVKVRGPRDTRDAGEKSVATAPTEPQALPRLVRQSSVNLDVDLGKKLRLRGRGLDTALQGELKLTTPGGRLAVHGAVRTQGGTYAAYGQKLDIERGVLAFAGPVDTPRLDILALRPNTDIRVGVAVSGTPQAPRARLFSAPDMGETDKLSWLLLGRGSEGLARTDTAVLQRATVALLAGEGEAPTDSFLRAFGIDDLSLRQSEGDARDTVIRLGKQLSRNWYAGYERGVNATAGTFQLIYRVAQRFTLRAQSGLENSVDLIWTWRYDQSPLSRPAAAPP